jgi:predicted NUDIX family phosphoesterase
MNEPVERVLVVEADWIHNLQPSRGFLLDINPEFLNELPKRAFFIDRPTAEADPGFRQVIPYVLVRHEGRILTVTRHKTGGEPRLFDKMSFGIGGHINPVDGEPENLLDAGLKRELAEELAADNPPGFDELRLLGLICDDTDEVSRVHLGVVLLWETGKPIGIRETDKMHGEYLAPDEIGLNRDRLENWSRLVYDGLIAASERMSR